MLQTAQVVASILREHRVIEAGPKTYWITEMERYYRANPRGARQKIEQATWIPPYVRQHMIRHLGIGRRRFRSRRRALRYIIGRKNVEYVEVKPSKKKPPTVFWSRDKLGRVYLHDFGTGRFVHTTEKEKRSLMKRGRGVSESE